ncbi:MAG: hypothetical protein ACT4QC_18705 [Planctomycetaceae bacterium]
MRDRPESALARHASQSRFALRATATPGLIVAALWVLLFLAYALQLSLPNNTWRDEKPITRGQLLAQSPSLIDLAAPLPLDASATPQERFFREHSGWKFFPQRFDLLAVAAAILVGAWGAGNLLLRLLKPPGLAAGLERALLAMALGLSALSLAMLLAGLAGWLSRPLLGSLLGIAVVLEVGLRIASRNPKSAIPNPQSAASHSAGTSALAGPILPSPSTGEGSGVGVSSSIVTRSPPHPQPFPREGEKGAATQRRVFSAAWLWLVILLPFLLAMLLGSLLPSVDFDVNEYHFLGPKEYFQNGRIAFLPHNVYTSFPFGTEMLTLFAMVLRDDWYRGALAGKCVLMAFGPLTALGLFAAGRRWFGATAGVLAAMLYLTTPWVYRISTIAYAEGGLSFYLFMALFTVMLAFVPARADELPTTAGASDSPGPGLSIDKHLLLLLAGLFAGSAMACKYPGAVSVVIPLFGAVAWFGMCRPANTNPHQIGTFSPSAPSRGEGWGGGGEHRLTRENTPTPSPVKGGRGRSVDTAGMGEKWTMPAVFALGMLCTIGPWLLKNAAETGNPVYPLLYTVFDGCDWDSQLNQKWRNGHKPPGYALLSQAPTEKGLAFMAVDVAARNDWVNLLLFAFAPVAFLRRDRRQLVMWLWLYVGYLFLTFWLLTHRIDRFWVPMTPVVALLAGIGAMALWEPAGPFRNKLLGRIACIAAFVLVLPVNLLLDVSPIGGYNEFLLDLEIASRDAARITAPEVAYLNERLPAGGKVLAVGDAEMFEARFPVVYNTVFDHSIFEDWCGDESTGASSADKPLRSADEIRRHFADQGITQLYVNWLEILRYRDSYGYTPFVTPARFAELQRIGILGPAWPIPEAVMDVSRLDPRQQKDLSRFAPELISRRDGKDTLTTYQVFDVLP